MDMSRYQRMGDSHYYLDPVSQHYWNGTKWLTACEVSYNKRLSLKI